MTPPWSPSASEHTRRTVLKATAAAVSTAAAGALAGCSGRDGNAGEDGDSRAGARDVSPRLDAVPSGAGAVTYTHVRDVLSDPAVTALLDAYFQQQSRSEYSDGPTSLSAAREQFDDASPVPLSGLRETVQFTGEWTATGRRMGLLLWTDWEESALVTGVEGLSDGTSLAERSHGGRTIYVPDTGDEPHYQQYALGVLGDGLYALGTEQAVRDAIDVTAGDAEALGGGIRGAFSASRPGPVQFAVDVPQEQLAEQAESAESGGFGPALLADVVRVYGSLYVAGDTRGIAVTFDATDAETATAVESALGTGLAGARRSVEPDDPMRDVLAETSVTTDGSTATLRYESSVSDVEALAADLASYRPPTPTPHAVEAEESDAPGVRFAGATGTDLSEDGVGALELTVERVGADGAVDLADARLLFHSDDLEYAFVHESSPDDADGHFATPDGTSLDSNGATARLRVDLGADTSGFAPAAVGEPLPAGSTVEVILIPGSGRPAPGVLPVPETLEGEEVALDVSQPWDDS